jgi:hypothetical protein
MDQRLEQIEYVTEVIAIVGTIVWLQEPLYDEGRDIGATQENVGVAAPMKGHEELTPGERNRRANVSPSGQAPCHCHRDLEI